MKFSACGVEDLPRFDTTTDVIYLKFDVNGRPIDRKQNYDLQRNPTWQHLQDWLKWFFGHIPERLTYFDEEGDSVSVGSDLEWEEALKVAKSNGNRLRLSVWSSKMSEGEASALYPLSDRDTGEDCRRGTSGDLPDCLYSMPSVPTSPIIEDRDLPDSLFSVRTSPTQEDLPSSSPPLWFTEFMQKFKQELSTDTAKKVNRKLQKVIASGGADLKISGTRKVSKEEEDEKEEEEFLSLNSIAKADDHSQSSTCSSGTVHDNSECPLLPNTVPKSVIVKSSCSQTSNSASGIDNLVCHNVLCHNCHSSIVGIRYKCGNCIDFDLCAACESENYSHDADHVFIKIRKPSKVVGSERKGKLSPLLRHIIYVKDNSERKRVGEHRCWKEHPESDLQQSLHLAASVELGEPKAMQRGMQQSETRLGPTIIQLRPVRATMDAEFLYDETVPDGARFLPGVKFTKIWRIFNSGSQPWSHDTMLKFLWGTKGFSPELLEVAVPALQPGQSGSVSVAYVAPLRRGHYESHWNLVHKGHLFGHRIWCSIEVVDPDLEVDALSASTNSVEVQEPENGEKQKLASATVQQMVGGVLSQNSDLLDCAASQINSINIMVKSFPCKRKETNSVLDGVDNCKEKDDHQDSELGSVVSLSSTDSESEFVVVPMPSCFDIPFVPSPVCPVNSSDVPETSTGECRKFSSSGSSVVFVKSDSEESIKGVLSDGNCSPVKEAFGIEIDHSYALPGTAISSGNVSPPRDIQESGPSCKSSDTSISSSCSNGEYVQMVTDLLAAMPDTAVARRLSMETGETFPISSIPVVECDDEANNNGTFMAECPPQLLIEVASSDHGEKSERCKIEHACEEHFTETVDEKVQSYTFTQGSADVNKESANPATTINDSEDGEKLVDIFPEGLVSAAASIFNSARQALSSVQWVSAAPNSDMTPPFRLYRAAEQSGGTGAPQSLSASPNDYATLSAILWDMGFCNNAANAAVIEKHCGDLGKIIDELLHQYDNDWHAHRH